MNTSAMANQKNHTTVQIKELKWNHPLLGVFFISLSLVTVSGNILVICAVIREPCLKTATNYYIISLAVADLLVGCVVAPFNGLSQMTFGYWFFGQFWCDMLYSFDVFASTASILSLLMIALDRYAAISDPIQYHYCWIRRHWAFFITGIWICSACISFPAIVYWRHVAILYQKNQCIFTNDIYYIIFSSLISFYIPLIVMIVVYIRIYMTALIQVNALRIGQKRNVRSSDGTQMTLRIHRGGYHGVNLSHGKSINQHNVHKMSTKNIQNGIAFKDDYFKKRKSSDLSQSTRDKYYTDSSNNCIQELSIDKRRYSCASKINCEKEKGRSSQILKLVKEEKNEDTLMESKGVVQFLYYPSMSKTYNYNESKQFKSVKKFSFEQEFRKSINSTVNSDHKRQIDKDCQYQFEESIEVKSIAYSDSLKSRTRDFSKTTSPNNLSRLTSLATTSSDYDETLSLTSKQYLHTYLRSGATGQCHRNSLANRNKNEHNKSSETLEFSRQHYQDHLEYQKRHFSKKFFPMLWNFIKVKFLRISQTSDQSTSTTVTKNLSDHKSLVLRHVVKKRVGLFTGARNKFSQFSREQKAAKTLGIVMGVFIICWMPFFTLNVMTCILKAKLPERDHDIIFAIFTWLGYLNSGCNPVIYAFNSRDFRRAFFKILCPTNFRKHKRKKMQVISNNSGVINQQKIYGNF